MPPSIAFGTATPPGLSGAKDTPEARTEAARQFEALLLQELMKAMRATANVGSDDDGDAFARGSYEEMFDQALVDATAGGLGIAELFERQVGSAIPPRNPVHRPAESLLSAASRTAALTHREAAPHEGPRHLGPRDRDGIALASGVPSPGLWPVDDGVQSSTYGWRMHPIHDERRFHAGLDIAAPEGREIRAVDRGVVTFAGRHKGFGNMVELTHADGIVTRYAHASRLHVREGDVVDVGETIADVGSTGQSTGPHLHFEVRDGSRTMDPLRYLERLRRGDGRGADADAQLPVVARVVKDGASSP